MMCRLVKPPRQQQAIDSGRNPGAEPATGGAGKDKVSELGAAERPWLRVAAGLQALPL